MTIPGPGYTPAPAPAPGYGYSTAPYLAPAKRPPLTKRARRGALIAGGVGFALWNFGWSILGILAVGVLIATVVSWISDSTDGSGSLRDLLDGFSSNVDGGSVILFAIVIGVVAVVLIVLSVLVSGWILRGHGVASRWGVTWAGLGISVVVNGILGFVVSVFGQVFTAFSTQAAILDRHRGGFNVAPIFGSAAAWVAAAIVIEVAVGAFAWWWMAHAMRPRTASTDSAASAVSAETTVSAEPPPGVTGVGSNIIQEN